MQQLKQPNDSISDQSCRRRADRIPTPVEVCLLHNGRHVPAVIRDVSFDTSDSIYPVGVGILHKEDLPLHQPLGCKADDSCTSLPVHSEVVLLWTRSVGPAGYLSGGRLLTDSGVSN